MTLGAGTSAAGVSDAGTGDVDQALAPVKGLLLDPYNGVQRDARNLDPYTKQYLLNANGSTQGMPSIAQMVQLRLCTIKGSSAVATLGIALPADTITSQTKAQVTDSVTQALKDMTDAKYIVLVSVDVSIVGTTQERVVVKWRDLTQTLTGTQTSTV